MMKPILTSLALISMTGAGMAEVVTASPDHFTLKLEAETELAPNEVWARLIVPSEWWQSDHTYSGDAKNLSLDVQAGGLWREDWDGGSVWHGTVIQAHENKSLILSAPFGPLQGLAVTSVWTITLTPHEAGGTKITFDHVTNGTDASGLDQMAPAVDFVKGAALASLARPRDE
ncbi:MAG: SRPBCC family protein [Hyphomonadaceae bacterium]|nr:SRPBCC family protein [Hyphomonadaceae bacterium]